MLWSSLNNHEMLSVMQRRLRPGFGPLECTLKIRGKKVGLIYDRSDTGGGRKKKKEASTPASQSTELWNKSHFTVSGEAFENNPTEGQRKHGKVQNQLGTLWLGKMCYQLPSALQPSPLGPVVHVLEVKIIAVGYNSPKMIDASLTKCFCTVLKKKRERVYRKPSAAECC